MDPTSTLSKSGLYTSMRVHGNSAHISYDPPDMPAKQVRVNYSASGAVVESNYSTSMDVYFSIPTPVQVEQQRSLFSLISRLFAPRDQVDKVFSGLHVRAVRVEIYLGSVQGVSLGDLEVMDGSKRIASVSAANLPLIDAKTDPYHEEPPGTIRFNLDREVGTALGIKLGVRFSRDTFEENRLHLIAAKAIFVQNRNA